MNEPDVHAVNRDFTCYDQVTKTHTYRLAESAADEFDTDYEIATFDVGRYLHGNARDRQASIHRFMTI